MKIAHTDFNNKLELLENMGDVVVIENARIFYEMVSMLRNQCESNADGKIVLSELGQELSLSKSIVIIRDPFDMDLSSRKIVSKLYCDLKENAYESTLYMESCQILSEMEMYLDKLLETADYAMEYDHEIDLIDLLKIVNARIQREYTSLQEQIIDYIDIMQKLLKIRIVVMINMRGYLTTEEIKNIYESSFYQKMHIIFLEPREPLEKLEIEKYYIIDEDGCEIY